MSIPTPPFTLQQVADIGIFELFGDSPLTKDDQNELLEVMEETIDAMVVTTIEEELPKDQLDAFHTIIDTLEGQEYATQLDALLTANKLTLDELYLDAALEYKVQLCQQLYGTDSVVLTA